MESEDVMYWALKNVECGLVPCCGTPPIVCYLV